MEAQHISRSRLRAASRAAAARFREAYRPSPRVATVHAPHEILLSYADRIEKAEPYLRNTTIGKWCHDIARDMREDAMACLIRAQQLAAPTQENPDG